jgi:hypothetical protein
VRRFTTRRSHAELDEMLDGRREWKWTGRHGTIFGYADCLRDAMKTACEGRGVIACASAIMRPDVGFRLR